MTVSARDSILAAIQTALPGRPVAPEESLRAVPRLYTTRGSLTPEARLELFIDRLLDYDTEILQVQDEAGLPEAVSEALQRANITQLLAAAEFPASWLPSGADIIRDTALSTNEIDHLTTVITTCELAIASTGTIILVHAGSQGRRILTLLPDIHICLVRRNQIVETVPEAIAAIASQSTRPITTISGPSATSDIEMTRIRGVHGPRRLFVVLYASL